MRPFFCFFALTLLVTFSGCHCGKKTDEEILLERIDTTSVHLYLATKVAIIKSDASPEAAEAKKHVLAALEVINRAARDLDKSRSQGTALPPPPAPALALPGNTIPASATSGMPSSPPPPNALSAADIAKLLKAVWGLKQEGKTLVKGRREDDLPPIIPVLVGSKMPPELAALLDSNTEHSLFLMALFALKFHPDTPVPVPPEILLYEAWMTRAEAIKLPGWNVPVRAMKAMVYAQNELCDLTAAEGEGLEKEKDALTAERVGSAFKTFGTGAPNVSDKQAKELSASARSLAHGAAAVCYFKRDERPKALDELAKFIDAAHEAGVPRSETALARAYLAYEKKDYETAKLCLEEAKSDPSVDDETKKQIDALTSDFTKKDDAAVNRFFNRTYFSALCVKLVLLRVERSGLFDEVLKTEPVKAVRGYLFATTKMLASAKESIPSVDQAKQMGTELIDGFKK